MGRHALLGLTHPLELGEGLSTLQVLGLLHPSQHGLRRGLAFFEQAHALDALQHTARVFVPIGEALLQGRHLDGALAVARAGEAQQLQPLAVQIDDAGQGVLHVMVEGLSP